MTDMSNPPAGAPVYLGSVPAAGTEAERPHFTPATPSGWLAADQVSNLMRAAVAQLDRALDVQARSGVARDCLDAGPMLATHIETSWLAPSGLHPTPSGWRDYRPDVWIALRDQLAAQPHEPLPRTNALVRVADSLSALVTWRPTPPYGEPLLHRPGHITRAMLHAAGACDEGLDDFEDVFPEGVIIPETGDDVFAAMTADQVTYIARSAGFFLTVLGVTTGLRTLVIRGYGAAVRWIREETDRARRLARAYDAVLADQRAIGGPVDALVERLRAVDRDRTELSSLRNDAHNLTRARAVLRMWDEYGPRWDADGVPVWTSVAEQD